MGKQEKVGSFSSYSLVIFLDDRTVTPSELRRQHVSKGQSHSKSSSSNSDDVKTADIRHKAPDLKQSASAKDPSARVTEGVFAPGNRR